MAAKVKAGFIGLGNQGAPIAIRQLQQGIDVCVWARKPQSLEPFVAAGATTAPSASALAAVCDVVGVCVVNDDDVREVVLGENGVLAGMKPGGVIAIHATVAPQTVVEVAEAAAKKGVHVLDAPVSGGPHGAKAGTMTVMVGGDQAALDIALPVFEAFADTIPLLGPVGSGQMMKLLNNNLCYANVAMSISALEVAAKLGMDVQRAGEIMGVSSGSSAGLAIVTNEKVLRKAAGPGSNVRKDFQHFLSQATKAGAGDAAIVAVAGTAADRLEDYAAKLPQAS